jgi:outer membrane protein OmpA-like peptidoglycan-associated protein
MRGMARGLVGALVVVASMLGASAARAQTPPLGDFSALRFTPAPGPGNYFMVDGGRVSGALNGSAGLMLDYAFRPLQTYPATCDAMGNNCSVSGTAQDIVSDLAVAHLFGSIALWDRLQISLTVPLALEFGSSFVQPGPPPQPTLLPGGSAFAIADPRLHVKVNLLDDNGSGFRLAAVVYGTAPLGHLMAPHHYVGDETPTFGGHLVGELVHPISGAGNLHVAANLGGMWRDGQQLFSTPAQAQLTYALAVGYEITPLIDVFAEVVGGTSFTSRVDGNNLEGRLGARIRVDDVVFSLGAGPGLIAGIGTPVFRVLGGFMWAPVSTDQDHDGIQDANDACPTEAEDMDGHDDADGCPDDDNDGDGVPDVRDQCPDQPEDLDGQDDADGCPDLDTDGDGIADGYDSCPTQPEDMDGDRDDDGCPDDDRDRDHIPDAQDQCPDVPEDTDGYGDEDGCPETDYDNDGIPDDSDQCPDQAEDMDGFEDDDGCPEEGHPPGPPGDRDSDTIHDAHDQCPDQPEDHDGFQDADGCPDPDNDGDGVLDADDHCPTVAGTAADQGCPHEVDLDLAHGTITLISQVEFATGRDVILDRSIPIMQQVLDVLVSHPEITAVRVEGHTDGRGVASRNLDLSGRRAGAVRTWLVAHGIDTGRLTAFGCGQLHPIGDNATDAGRQANRRVAFIILEPAAAGLEVFGDCHQQP